MPYAPGVVDNSGQIIAQGMINAANARASSMGNIGQFMSNIGQDYGKYQEEYKDLTAKNKAIENIISTHPEIFAPKGADGSPDAEKLSMFLQTDPNENLKQKYARISSFMEGTITSKKMEQMSSENAARAAQAEHAKAEAAKINFGLEQDKADAAWFAQEKKRREENAAQFITPPSGAQADLKAGPNIQNIIPGEPSDSGAPESIQQFSGPRAVSTQVAPPATQDFLTEARYRAREQNLPRSAIPGLEKQLQKEAMQARAQSKLHPTMESAQAEADAFNADPKNSRALALAEPDPARGGFIVKTQPAPFKTPAQEGASAQATALGSGAAKSALDFDEAIKTAGLSAADRTYKINRMENLLNKTETGFLANETTTVRQFLSEVGLGDKANSANEQELKGLFAEEALRASREFYKGQGPVSNQERARIDKTVTDFSKGNITNAEFLKVVRATNAKHNAAEEERQRLIDDENMDAIGREKVLRKWWRQNPLDNFITDKKTLTADEIYQNAMGGKK